MQQDPTLFAIDQILRILTLSALQAVVYVPILVGVAYLHARWSKARK